MTNNTKGLQREISIKDQSLEAVENFKYICLYQSYDQLSLIKSQRKGEKVLLQRHL